MNMKNESYLLIVQLYQEKHLEEVVVALAEAGIRDVMSFSGVNEFRRLPYNIPIFSGFKTAVGKSSPLGKILIATVENPKVPEILLESLKRAEIDLLGNDLGSIILIPAGSIWHH